MNKEIKEILEVLKKYDFSKDVPEEIEGKVNKLLDYITNLEKENDRLKDELKRLHNLLNSQAYQDLDKYKSKNEKAIEYIDIFIQCINEQRTTDKEKIIIGRLKNLKSLLKGDSSNDKYN